MKRRARIFLILPALLVATGAAWAWLRDSGHPPPAGMLDLRMGEYLTDTLERSSYDLSKVGLWTYSASQILLTPFENDRPRSPAVTLREEGKAVTLPFIPARGNVYINAGIIEELDLSFFNFPALGQDGGVDMRREFDSTSLGTLEGDIQAIIRLHKTLEGLGWIPDPEAYCAPFANRRGAITLRQEQCLAPRCGGNSLYPDARGSNTDNIRGASQANTVSICVTAASRDRGPQQSSAPHSWRIAKKSARPPSPGAPEALTGTPSGPRVNELIRPSPQSRPCRVFVLQPQAKTDLRIQEAISALGYAPNHLARGQ